MDKKEFQEFYLQTNFRLYGYLCRVSNDPDLSKDITQESFLKFLVKPPSGNGFSARKSYLFTIASRLLADYYREIKRKKDFEELAEKEMETITVSADTEKKDLKSVLETLNDKERALLWLAYVEGYSHKEIAKITADHKGSIKVMLFRIREKLRKTRPDQSAIIRNERNLSIY